MVKRIAKSAILKRTVRRDLFMLGLFSFLCYILAYKLDAFDRIYEYTRSHEDWELDEIIATFIVVNFAFAVFSYRRWRETLAEIEQRKQTEADLAKTQRVAATAVFAHGIAHHFNNINATIIGSAENALTDGIDKEDLHACLKSILKGAWRSTEIVKGLGLFSGALENRREMQSPTVIINNIIEIIKPSLNANNIKLGLSSLKQVDRTMINTTGISQAIFAIIQNAQHALNGVENATITISTEQTNKDITIIIADNGCGIPPEEIDHIFTPFHTTKGEFAKKGSPLAAVRGAGLGLCIANTIITDHDGKIDVHSSVGFGTTVTITIPINKTFA
ncbi:MAG: HAMP domain-containing histidine kinase [Planctomycetes bacterium]|nr:HAMP domain-containing histidine kinase [Planctomycetota bacterium]